MDTAVSSGADATTATVVPRITISPSPLETETETENDTTHTNGVSIDTRELKKALAQRKYRHFAAVHSKDRPSTLSHDATETPSFLGFRNLGLIVLSELIALRSYVGESFV